MKKSIISALCFVLTISLYAQKEFKATSPDGRIVATINLNEKLTYSISHDGQTVLNPSPLSITLSSGEVWGDKPQLSKSSQKSISQTIPSPFYRKDQIKDEYTLLTLTFKKQWEVEFRVYNDGVAYRFVNKRSKPFTIKNEEVAYNFGKDVTATVPYVAVGKDGDYEAQFHSSFENFYTTAKISALNKERLMFLPLVVESGNG